MDQLNQVADQLKANGIEALVVEDAAAAKAKIEELIPQGAQVMTMTSQTLEQAGINDLINNSGNYKSVRQQLTSMDRQTQGLEMNRLGATPEYTLGSVHAVTEDGKVLVASNTGSQLPAYAYASPHVIWVVGKQKLVKDLDAGLKRIYEHVLPLEHQRAQKAYGVGSNVSKLLIINRETQAGRLTLILVNQELGF